MNPVPNTYGAFGTPRIPPQPLPAAEKTPASETVSGSSSPFDIGNNHLAATAVELQRQLPRLSAAALANLMLNQSTQPATYQQVEALRATYQMGPIRELPGSLG